MSETSDPPSGNSHKRETGPPARRPRIHGLDSLQIGGLGPARIRLNVERHLLALGQGAHARRFDGGSVNEHVLAAAIRRDKAKTLGAVEELHGTDCHLFSLSQKFRPREMRVRPWKQEHSGLKEVSVRPAR